MPESSFCTDDEARELRKLWTLEPDLHFLNHGSFGACPREILEEQSAFRARIERQPLQFFRDLEGLLDEVRGSLAALLGADADDLALVPNASTGVGCVVRSLLFSPGDEILTTDHVYNSCKNILALTEAQGARVVIAKVPFPIERPEQVTEALLGAVTPKTKLALVDHITSATGLIFPISEIVRELQSRGVDVLVDGAHAPGQVPVDLNALGAAYYTGNCHKWLCTPKGSAFLHVRCDKQDAVLPHTISHGFNSARTDRSRFRLRWDNLATVDPTAWLCIPSAIRFLGRLFPGGLPELQQRNRALALEGQRILCEALEIPRPAPPKMIGSLATVPLPDRPKGQLPPHGGAIDDPLGMRLLEKHRCEVPISAWQGPTKRLTRISAQCYVTRADLVAFAGALKDELAAEHGGQHAGLC